MSQIRAHSQVSTYPSRSGAGVGAIPLTMLKSILDYPKNIFQNEGSNAQCSTRISTKNEQSVTDQQRETNFTHHQPLAPQIGQFR